MEEVLLDNGKERGAALELALEKALAGWMTPGSGNKNIKGDVRSKMFCAEAKYRSSKDSHGYFIALDLQWLESIWRTAKKSNRIALLAIEFGDGTKVAFIPVDQYELLSGDSLTNSTIYTFKGRAPEIRGATCKYMECKDVVEFPDIEVEERVWAMVDWEELILLRKLNQEPKKKIKFR